jgi:hypothetical protein
MEIDVVKTRPELVNQGFAEAVFSVAGRKLRALITAHPGQVPVFAHDGRWHLGDASFVYPTGGAEGVGCAYRILVTGEKPQKKVTLGTDEIYPSNAMETCAKYECKQN